MSGGLEVASDRLLALMKKGVSVEQVARVTKGFTDAGILVHAYLMYGFPTQTLQDTVDALEYVRQLFENGCIQSGFFHRFSCTVHSPVGMDPAAYGVELVPLPEVRFAKNDIGFTDPTPMPPGVDHDVLGQGLRKAIYNYMHGLCVDDDVRRWFEHLPCPVPQAHRQAREDRAGTGLSLCPASGPELPPQAAERHRRHTQVAGDQAVRHALLQPRHRLAQQGQPFGRWQRGQLPFAVGLAQQFATQHRIAPALHRRVAQHRDRQQRRVEARHARRLQRGRVDARAGRRGCA